MRAYQNLDNGRVEPKQQKPTIYCNWCTKKYKTQAKYEAHVAKNHPFAAYRKNTLEFTLDEKLWILFELQKYIQVLRIGNTDLFAHATSHLGELERMLPIHTLFKERIMPHLDMIESEGYQVLSILEDFQAFLNLGIPWRGGNFCPSLLIDLVWHASMQCKEKYAALVNRFLGQPLTHCLVENDGDMTRFDEFVKQFKHQHGRDYLKIENLRKGRGDGIREACMILKREDEIAKEKLRIQQAKWDADCERQRQIVEEQKRLGTYVKYTDDGKC